MSQVLRPVLYRALRSRFGEVRIVREGQAVEYHYEFDSLYQREDLKVTNWGETYFVSCPFCGESRFRLSISHAWCSPDSFGNPWKLTKLIKCFNETDCLSDPVNRRELAYWLFHEEQFPEELEDSILPATQSAVELKPFMPGDVVRLESLPETHPALVYLRNRRFVPEELARDWQLGYCTRANSGCGPAQGRLFIPVMHNNLMQGWQARSLGTPSPGLPAYWGMPAPGWKSQCLYGLDYALAADMPWVCVVEGATDVWRLKDLAVGLLGSDGSHWQLETLIQNWQTVVILLDRDAKSKASKLQRRLQGKIHCPLVLELPDKRDPADYHRDLIIRFILQEAADQGVELAIPEMFHDPGKQLSGPTAVSPAVTSQLARPTGTWPNFRPGSRRSG